ncbi:hypothetical protein G6L74_05630 [Agrobacterium tumefaciens]|uniref:hypothetical protein n=1 Tax=Agrobacterium tumefaciens TaxID=358 RepID=UPI0015747D08|nr:hypothetical protein [Agrobacterium tumefaciens]
MHPLLMRVTRGKRERIEDYCVRVMAHHCNSDIPGSREDMIAEVLQFYRDRVEEFVEEREQQRATQERWRLSAKLSETEKELDKFKNAYTTLRENTPTSIPVREAEEGCLKAFNLAREKAAMLMEDEGGQPTNQSEAIRAIPDPKPRWSRV